MSSKLKPAPTIILLSVVLLGSFLSRAPAREIQFGQIGQPPVEPEFSGRFDLTFADQRIWRGMELNPEGVFQPLIRINDRGFEVELRTSLDLTDVRENRANLNEWHYRIGFARREPGAEASFTYNYYRYPEGLFEGMTKTQEVALETSWGWPVVNGFNVYWDFDEVHGLYFNYSLGYRASWGSLTVFPSAAAGFATRRYQRHYFNRNRDSFLDLECSLAVELEVWRGVVFTAEGLYYELLTAGLRNRRKETARGDHFFFRGGMSLRF